MARRATDRTSCTAAVVVTGQVREQWPGNGRCSGDHEEEEEIGERRRDAIPRPPPPSTPLTTVPAPAAGVSLIQLTSHSTICTYRMPPRRVGPPGPLSSHGRTGGHRVSRAETIPPLPPGNRLAGRLSFYARSISPSPTSPTCGPTVPCR
jgi:hypothetical protein